MLSKVIETPSGVPVNDRETGALKLLMELTEMYNCPVPPCMTLRVLGEALRVKVLRSCAFAGKQIVANVSRNTRIKNEDLVRFRMLVPVRLSITI